MSGRSELPVVSQAKVTGSKQLPKTKLALSGFAAMLLRLTLTL